MWRAAIRRRPALLAALAVFVAGALLMGLTHHQASLPLPRAKAVAAALRSPRAQRALHRNAWNRVTVYAVDNHLDRVTFLEGGQVVEEVAIRPDGRIAEAVNFKALAVPYGDWIAYLPGVLVFLAALFVLVTAVAP